MPDVLGLGHTEGDQAAPADQAGQTQAAEGHPGNQTGLVFDLGGPTLPAVLALDYPALILEQRDRSPWGAAGRSQRAHLIPFDIG